MRTVVFCRCRGNASVGDLYAIPWEAKDEDGNQAEALAVVAVEASLFLADMPSLVAFTEITLSLHTFAASGGIGAKTYILAAGEGQEYFTLNATSGVLSAANAALGVYTLSVTVSDSRGNSAQVRGHGGSGGVFVIGGCSTVFGGFGPIVVDGDFAHFCRQRWL